MPISTTNYDGGATAKTTFDFRITDLSFWNWTQQVSENHYHTCMLSTNVIIVLVIT